MTILFDPPPRVDSKLVPLNLQGWLRRFYNEILGVNATGLVWTAMNFTGSNITDIATRHHNDMQIIQGGALSERYHLTQIEHDDLTLSNNTTLHFHLADRNETHIPFIMLASPLSL